MSTPYYQDEHDPMPLRGGVCDVHGEFNNFSGECLACRREAGE